MPPRDAGSRERIIVGAADLIRRRGLAGSTVRDLAAHSGAPLGSTYHYFPRGKQQLAAEAVRFSGGFVLRTLERELQAGPAAGLRAFLALWKRIVLDSDFTAGCPVLAVAVEEPPADGEPEAVRAAAEVFTAWEDRLATSLRDHGATEEAAAQLATLIVAAVEGAIALCRTKQDIAPLDAITPQLETLIKTATHP
ncbi:TetR/AcrR family transcriptional regulator [Actinocorallia sp. API 0066]|uniref:TetR/AcrR family transcriptional regulator n=1 Tax=Actinocorallia sp. API 0066 TaxID=2896846 RepID=UPI001E3CE9C8|nr:TetR/AcrR family transcriptional regulator [Actinocorallia sp. API 0066]MCD0452988.1 TetR/AcrR family transcriptional regulator [Actinocorallia sp. API 0066]